jgi:hypothetical protein
MQMTNVNGMTAVWNVPMVSHYEFMMRGVKIAEVDSGGAVVMLDIPAMVRMAAGAPGSATQAIAALVAYAYLQGAQDQAKPAANTGSKPVEGRLGYMFGDKR